jgi:hypothetical protein
MAQGVTISCSGGMFRVCLSYFNFNAGFFFRLFVWYLRTKLMQQFNGRQHGQSIFIFQSVRSCCVRFKVLISVFVKIRVLQNATPYRLVGITDSVTSQKTSFFWMLLVTIWVCSYSSPCSFSCRSWLFETRFCRTWYFFLSSVCVYKCVYMYVYVCVCGYIQGCIQKFQDNAHNTQVACSSRVSR